MPMKNSHEKNQKKISIENAKKRIFLHNSTLCGTIFKSKWDIVEYITRHTSIHDRFVRTVVLLFQPSSGYRFHPRVLSFSARKFSPDFWHKAFALHIHVCTSCMCTRSVPFRVVRETSQRDGSAWSQLQLTPRRRHFSTSGGARKMFSNHCR